MNNNNNKQTFKEQKYCIWPQDSFIYLYILLIEVPNFASKLKFHTANKDYAEYIDLKMTS